MLRTKTPPLADCGLPSFSFAGFTFPRYLATIESGALRQRVQDRKTGLCGAYYHAPLPRGKIRGFYLEPSRALGMRWEYADETDGARINHREWSRTWPCFGTPRATWFQFDKRNGDLVDMKPGADRDCDPSGILALSQDAQLWGELRRGNLFAKSLPFGSDIAQRYAAECKK